MVATIPLLGWILSSFVLHGVGLALPNGLQGVYELEPHHPDDVRLEELDLVAPREVFRALAGDGLDRVYWLRLEQLGGVPAYVVKPGPFDPERVYDARTGARLDPLPDSLLLAVANGELKGTRVVAAEESDEFNRYYTVERVPALAMTLEGDQPSEVVFSKGSGRVLRRTDPLAAWFHAAYRSVHVWQWGDSVRLFSTLLYGLAALALILVGLGSVLWWSRREARTRWTTSVHRGRRIHARLAPVAGVLLATQMLVGAYLWFNLGLIEPRFRGQGSFQTEWSGGIRLDESPAEVATIAAALPDAVLEAPRPIQRYEWRAVGEERFWLAYPRRDRNGVLIEAGSRKTLDRLPAPLAARAGAGVVLGSAVGDVVESTEYWMDFNARVPTWLFRFDDPDATDVHVSQVTGEIVQRRPAIWRAFGPFLAYHTFAFTGNAWFDTVLLTALQLLVLAMIVSGWTMVLRRSPSPRSTHEGPFLC
jgi:hypothetical protein